VEPASDGPPVGLLPTLGDASAFHAREGQHQRHGELAEGGHRVDAQVDGGQLDFVLVQLLDELQRVGDASTRKAVQAGDDDAFQLASADGLHHRVQARP
jgi:hypothetical protein